MHLFTFKSLTPHKENISSNLLPYIEAESKHILTDRASIDNYIKLLGKERPEYILGLGSWSGRDSDKIRIETLCTNKWRNSILGEKLVSLNIESFVKLTHHAKFSNKMGNSYCNYISWSIANLINESIIPSQYTFLHIPESMEPSIAARYISEILETK